MVVLGISKFNKRTNNWYEMLCRLSMVLPLVLLLGTLNLVFYSILSRPIRQREEELNAVTKGVYDSAIETNSLSFDSYILSGSEVTKKVYILPIFDESSMSVVVSLVPCIQERLSNTSIDNTNEMIPIVVGINLEQESMNELEKWKYFDFIRLPMNQDLFNALNQSLINEQVIQHHVIKFLVGKFAKQTISYQIENKDNIFDYKNTLRLMGIEHLSCVGKIETKKFALVIPFPFSQIEATLMQLERWERVPPCKGKAKIYQDKTDLIFYYHKKRFEYMEQQILKALTDDRTTNGTMRHELQCFNSHVHFIYANLSKKEDLYPQSPSRMFYKLIDDSKIYTHYSYFFYSEPDTYPIRDGWLNRILDQAYLPTTQWWVSGSIYRGKISARKDGKKEDDLSGGDLLSFYENIHINGNALYNLCNNFRDFTWDVRKMLDMTPYDTAFIQYLHKFGWRLTRKLWHHFLYSDFILNMENKLE
jgi:hypothetical protein